MFAFIKKLLSKQQSPSKEEDLTVKYLITGLGNVGAEYNDTRHNVGFDIVDYLAAKYEVSYKSGRYGYTGSFRFKGRTFVLLKPTTYMNLSGQAIRFWLQKEKIKLPNLLVITDDLNIQLGQVKLKTKGSAGGHNGLKNTEQLLNTNKYSRLRIGIGNNYRKGQQVDFVLGKWKEEELPLLDKVIAHAAEAVLAYATIGVERTMNRFNQDLTKPKPVKKSKPKSNTSNSEDTNS